MPNHSFKLKPLMDMAVISIAGTTKELWQTYSSTIDKMSSFELTDYVGEKTRIKLRTHSTRPFQTLTRYFSGRLAGGLNQEARHLYERFD